MTNITSVRLSIQLRHDYLSSYEKRMLMRYGEAKKDGSIIREILIPSDMPLHNLHYTIQQLFGWKNSHLREFTLPEDVYEKLTKNTVRGWAEFVGVLFQPPSEAEHDIFWDDDYKSGSIRAWLRKKYTGPYVYGGIMEHPEVAKRDIQELLDRFPMIDVQESFQSFVERIEKEGEGIQPKVIKRAPLIDLTLEEMNAALYLPGGTESLMESLIVDEVLSYVDERTDESFFPVTDQLYYYYDFGDNWTITITKHKDCNDLIANNFIDENELEEAQARVIHEHRPVCIHKEGIQLLDDVGGLRGFANFLGTIFEGEDKEEIANMRRWARSFGWNTGKISLKNML